MLLGTNEKQTKEAEESPIDQKAAPKRQTLNDCTQTITIKQTSNRPQVDDEENVSLSSSVPNNTKSRKQLSLLNQATGSQCCWHKLQEQETYYDTYLIPDRMFESDAVSGRAANETHDDEGSSAILLMKSQPASEASDTIEFLRSSLFYQVEDEHHNGHKEEYEYDEEDADEYDDVDDDDDDVNGPMGCSRPLVLGHHNLLASSTPSDINLIASSDAQRAVAYDFQRRRHSQNPKPSTTPAESSPATSTTTNTTSSSSKPTRDPQSHLQQLNQHQHYLTIEELKLTLNSCWLCGCNWQEDHVSLDCPECGGYAMSRSCPNCDGKCRSIWTRNITKTHDSHKATWVGQCSWAGEAGAACSRMDSHRLYHPHRQAARLQTSATSSCCGNKNNDAATKGTTGSGGKSHPLASSSSCCSSQPSSAASSDCDEEAEELLVLGEQ